jgi:signal transduction histidine kinase/DNA-binding NarL/FixJ family response regulator
MRLSWLIAIVWMLAPAAVLADPFHIEDRPQQRLQGNLAWCTAPNTGAAQPAPPEACAYRVRDYDKLPGGFSDVRHWLRFRLHNPATTAVERWLEVGQPRLQEVTLWRQQRAQWQALRTGQSIPTSQRPLVTQRLLLPIRLAAGETADFYLEVFAETHVDLRLTLWQLPNYFAQEAKLQIIQALGMGGLMLAALFTLMIFAKQRQPAMLWLCASFVTEILLDASYTGMLSAYFWPANRAYEIRLHGLFVSLTVIFFILFVRSFLNTPRQYPRENKLLLLSLAMILLGVAGFAWEYSLPIRVIALAALLSMSLSILLFFRAWRQGSGPAGYLLLSYLLLLGMIIYRASSAFGWVGGVPFKELGYSWYFLLITPTTLLGILKRSEVLRDDLIRAEADRQAQTRFLAQMSHELRSPLNSVISHARLLQRQPEPEQITTRAGNILASGQRLLGMIDEILDHARLQAGKLQLNREPMDLPDFLRQLADDQALAADKAGNRFELRGADSLPAMILADERRLRQILDNLLSNAHRYCQQGRVSLSVAHTTQDQDTCLLGFSVADSGPGIAPAEQAHIFLPFHRGQIGQRRGIDGVGVGLAIARQLVQLMGGELHLDSQLGHGSRFSFTIACPLSHSPAPAPVCRHAPQPFALLLVEDDPDHLDSLAQLLQGAGFITRTAHSAEAARAYRQQPIDLVITDQFMARGDGWQILSDWGNTHPVILLSAAPAQRPASYSGQARFQHELLKPLDLDQLLDAIAATLGFNWPAPQPPQAADPPQAPVQPQPIRPSPAQRQTLSQLIAAGAISDIQDWQAQLAQQQPELADYCQQIRQAVSRLDMAHLNALAD